MHTPVQPQHGVFCLLEPYLCSSLFAGYYHPQETSIIQTTANSVLDLNWAGGFHSFLVALSGPVMSQFFGQANITASDVYEPLLSRIIPYQVVPVASAAAGCTWKAYCTALNALPKLLWR